MPSTRRALLTSIATTAAVGVAGCTSSESSSSEADCASSNFDHADPEIIHAVRLTRSDNGNALFVVNFHNDVAMQELDLISVYDASDTLAFSIPVVAGGSPDGTRRTYAQTLSPRPHHGRYRVVVTDTNGDIADEVTADLHCYQESNDA